MFLRKFARVAVVTLMSLGLAASIGPATATADDNGHWADGWASYSSGGAAVAFSDDTTVAHSGSASLKVTDGSGFAPNVYGTIAQSFATKPNTTYVFHAWIKSAGTRSTQFTVTSNWVERFGVPDGTYGWREFTFQHTTSASETSLTFRLLVQDVTTGFWLDDVSATEQGSSQNLLVNTGFEPGSGDAALYQRFTALANELPALKNLLDEAHGRNIPVDYPTVDYATISRFIQVGRKDVGAGQAARADYIAGVLERLHDQAVSETRDCLDGSGTCAAVPRYVTGDKPLQIRGRSFVGSTQEQGAAVRHDQTVFLTGYGHFSQVETDIPRFRDLGTNAVQFEIGPSSTIFPPSTPGWQPSAGTLGTSFARVTNEVHSGAGALRIGTAQGGSGSLAETFGAEPSTTYHFGLWTKAAGAAGTITVSTGSSSPVQIILPAGSHDWTHLEFSYTTTATENTVGLTIQAQNASGSTWIDDITARPNGTGADAVDNGGFDRTAPAGADFAVDDALVRTRIAGDLRAAERSDVAVNLLLSPHYMPQFVYDRTPGLHIPAAGFIGYDINNPEAKAVIAAHIRAVMSVVKNYSSLQSITLSNEPVYINSTTSSYTRQLWHDYLQRTYSSVEAMNRTWGTSYDSFDAVPPSDGGYQATPYFYDWVQFNNRMFAGWHQWMAEQVHAVDKTVPVQAKIMVFQTFSSQGTLGWGVDPELFDEVGQISGDDNYGFLGSGANGYALENETYDLQSSMKAAPVFNSEDHIIPDNSTDYGPLEAANARMTQWQGAIHGRSGSTIWVWWEAFNSMLVRPDVVDQVGRTGLDLNRLAGQVTAFQNAKPDVGILYSVASDLYKPANAYINATNSAYKALLYDGHRPGFVSENQAARGGLDRYRVVVLPRTTNVRPSTLTALREFEENGGKVVVIGTDALGDDEYDRPLDPATRSAVIDGAAEKFDAAVPFDTLRTTLLTDLQHWGLQDVTLMDADTGEPATGIEYETATYQGNRLLNIASYDAHATKRVYLDVDGHRVTGSLTDLISGHSLDTAPLALSPITPVLLQLPRP